MHPLTLDSRALSELYGGSDEDASFILHDYLDKHPEIINSLHAAFNSDIDSLSRCVHLHAPTFSYIGIPQLTTTCREFEQECKTAADPSALTKRFETIVGLVNQTAVLVRQELGRMNKTA